MELSLPAGPGGRYGSRASGPALRARGLAVKRLARAGHRPPAATARCKRTEAGPAQILEQQQVGRDPAGARGGWRVSCMTTWARCSGMSSLQAQAIRKRARDGDLATIETSTHPAGGGGAGGAPGDPRINPGP